MPFNEMYFNIDHGYLEGLVRGFKGGILTQADYTNLCQCERETLRRIMTLEKQVQQQNKVNEKLEARTRALQKEISDLIKLGPKSAALPESELAKGEAVDCPTKEDPPHDKPEIKCS